MKITFTLFVLALSCVVSCASPRVPVTAPIAAPDGVLERIMDAHPQMGSSRKQSESYLIRLDPSSQVLRLEIQKEIARVDRDLENLRQSLQGIVDSTLWTTPDTDAPLYPTLEGLIDDDFVPAGLLAQKAKLFDDGLYATVELAVQNGTGGTPSKKRFLRLLCQTLIDLESLMPRESTDNPNRDGPPPSVHLMAALRMGGQEFTDERVPEKTVSMVMERFNDDPLKSKPLGFYTWSPELEAIFRQDRFLQREIDDPRSIDLFISALRSLDEFERPSPFRASVQRRPQNVGGFYPWYLSLIGRMTNDFDSSARDFRSCLAGSEGPDAAAGSSAYWLFPKSRSFENDLALQINISGVSKRNSLMESLIAGVRCGNVDLTPRSESGWYDHQTYALEPFVIPDSMPEAARLEWNDPYREHLLDLFRGVLSLSRETHVKQLSVVRSRSWSPKGPRPVITIRPQLDAEPIATFYHRRAAAYRFIRQVLLDHLGPATLESLRRWTPEGPVQAPLSRELEEMEALFRGACVTVCRQIGLPLAALADTCGAGYTPLSDEKSFARWRTGLAQDPDVSRDVRMMVPIYYDIQKRKTKVWVFLGWRRRWVDISFTAVPKVEVFDLAGRSVGENGPVVKFRGRREPVVSPVVAEVYVKRLLDRDEFRALCDKRRTRSRILAALE